MRIKWNESQLGEDFEGFCACESLGRGILVSGDDQLFYGPYSLLDGRLPPCQLNSKLDFVATNQTTNINCYLVDICLPTLLGFMPMLFPFQMLIAQQFFWSINSLNKWF